VQAIEFTSWRNNAEHVNYPFTDGASLTSNNGILLGRDTFDDARLYPIDGDEGLHLGAIAVDGSTVTITINKADGTSVGSVSYDAASAPELLSLVDSYGRPAGVLVSTSAKLSAIAGHFGQGTTEFDVDATPFAPSVIVPLPQKGVRGVVLDDGTVLTGDILLVGTDGIVLSVEDGMIRVDAIGDPYAILKQCEEDGVPIPPFCGVKTINRIKPDEHGDFKLFSGVNVTLDNVLRLEIGNGTVRLKAVATLGVP